MTSVLTGDVLGYDCEPRKGLACVNSQQPAGKTCEDYRVRFLCPADALNSTDGFECQDYCETDFLDRDDPGGYCDCETFSLSGYTGPTPVGIRCREKATGKDYEEVGQTMTCKPEVSVANYSNLHYKVF